MWGGAWVWFKKELIKQIVASLPQSTRLEYLQFFNEDFHLVLQQDFNNPDDIESALVDCLINLKDCSLHRTYGQLAWKTKNTCSIAVLP